MSRPFRVRRVWYSQVAVCDHHIQRVCCWNWDRGRDVEPCLLSCPLRALEDPQLVAGGCTQWVVMSASPDRCRAVSALRHRIRALYCDDVVCLGLPGIAHQCYVGFLTSVAFFRLRTWAAYHAHVAQRPVFDTTSIAVPSTTFTNLASLCRARLNSRRVRYLMRGP